MSKISYFNSKTDSQEHLNLHSFFQSFRQRYFYRQKQTIGKMIIKIRSENGDGKKPKTNKRQVNPVSQHWIRRNLFFFFKFSNFIGADQTILIFQTYQKIEEGPTQIMRNEAPSIVEWPKKILATKRKYFVSLIC